MIDQRVVMVFESADDLMSATRAVRESGWKIEEAYTPYAVHGLDEAMGRAPSRLPYITFLCGLVGTLLALWLQHWTSSVSWPLNVGGKPFNSLPAFVPVIFEIMVLFAGLGSVATLLIRSRLYPGKKVQLPSVDITNHRFALVLAPQDASFSHDEASQLCRRHNAVALHFLGDIENKK
ncbi:MAG: DUF3341 domain-containing protein [Planctomycetota bacterium]|jgi:hypothetical protein|nr:DUF3341 domain-containing protein [Planctomycetota bacterium]